MKRLSCIVLTLCLLLCACGGAPGETTAPAAPVETTAPGVDNDMSYREEELPIPEEPAGTTEPGEEDGDTLRVEDPETMLYTGPGFVSGAAGMVGEAGVYTIVEEAVDADGNTWGRLKSGAGWLCLTDPPLAPIYAEYAEESFNAYHAYWSDETDYITSVGFTAAETLTDVQFGLLDWFETESWQMDEVLYTIETMTPDQPFLAQVCFWGDMTTYGIRFTDADGMERHYAVSISGRDGSLLCTEYQP